MTDGRGAATGDRAVSSTLAYVLALAITVILVSGLLSAAGGFVDAEQDQVVRTELDVLAERLAGDLGSADRLATTVRPGQTASVTTSLPATVAGQGYVVSVTNVTTPPDPPYRYELVLETARTGVSVSTDVKTRVPVGQGEAPGGALVVEYADDDGDGTWELWIDDA